MDFHHLLDNWEMKKKGREAVFATIVKVKGHAYRKLGASMVLFKDGERLGGLSPGCLEADLEERVADVLTRGKAQYVEYDMSDPDDYAWGEAAGCGGSVHVLLEPVTERLGTVLSNVKKGLDLGRLCLLNREWDSNGFVSYKVERTEKQPLHAVAGRMSLQMYCEPRPRLIIFGAGYDAEPLAVLAKQAGFRVVVTDWREELCCSGKFPEECAAVVGSPAELAEKLEIGRSDYVVIMSHQMEKDRQTLELLWPLAPRYAGLLGSKTRAERLLQGRIPPDWLKAPVGLPIHAEGAEEIAVSIVAELIAVRRRAAEPVQGAGVHERQRSGNLFGRRAEPAYGGSKAFYTARQK